LADPRQEQNGFERKNFPQASPQSLESRQASGGLRFRLRKIFLLSKLRGT
jgi:hypothetical protein